MRLVYPLQLCFTYNFIVETQQYLVNHTINFTDFHSTPESVSISQNMIATTATTRN